MQSPETLWRLALLRQIELLKEAKHNQQLALAHQHLARLQPSRWQKLATRLGDGLIAAGYWLKRRARPSAPSPSSLAPKSGA